MLKERLAAAHAVRDAYMPLKLASADLSRRAASCMNVMVSERQTAGLKIGQGNDALVKVAQATALFAQGEKLIADAHSELAQLIEQSGLTRHFEYGYGQEDTHFASGLRVVSQEQAA